MANPKGTQFETALVPVLRLAFPEVARRGSAGHELGDFRNTGPFLLEAKNRKAMRLPDWLGQAEIAAAKEDKPFPVVIHKRKNFGPHGAWVTMRLSVFIKMLLHFKGLDFDDDEIMEMIKQVSDEEEVFEDLPIDWIESSGEELEVVKQKARRLLDLLEEKETKMEFEVYKAVIALMEAVS